MRNIHLMLALTMAWLGGAQTASAVKAAPSAVQAGALVAVLKSDAPRKEKADACRELARVGGREAVAPLAALLTDEELSHMARYALEGISDPAAVRALREALPKLQGRLLAGVIGSLGVKHDTRSVKPLTGYLESADTEVGQAAARALGKIATADAARALREHFSRATEPTQLSVAEGLFRCAESFAAKGRRKEAIVIYDLLRNQGKISQVRAGGLRGAILVRGTDGIPLLQESVRGEDPVFFVAALRASHQMPGEDVTRALAKEISGLSLDRQVMLIQILGKRQDAEALPTLRDAASRLGHRARVAAVRAMGEIGDQRAAPTLITLMFDADAEVSSAAQETLAGLPGREIDLLVRGLLSDPASGRRAAGLELAARRRMTETVPQLLEMAARDAALRVAAVRKLGELGGPSQVPALVDILNKAEGKEDLEAAEEALAALGARVGDKEAFASQLATQFGSAEPAKKISFLRVLGANGGERALKTVREASREANSDVRAAAIRALSNWPTPAAAPALLELAGKAENATERTLSLRGYLGFAASSEVQAKERLEMCREAAALVQKDEEKKLLVSALAGINLPQAITLITPYLDQEGIKEEAALATVNAAEKLLRGKQAERSAAKLIEPLETAARVTSNAEVVKRAQGLIEEAKKTRN